MGKQAPVMIRRTSANARQGITLVELLVVVSILVILAAVTIPSLRAMAKDRPIREGARSVSVYLGLARNRAMECGRPCGVMLDRREGLTESSRVLHQVEVPPPYCGDTMDASVKVGWDASGLRASFEHADQLPNLVHVGDLLQVNGQGCWYRITGPSDATTKLITSTTVTLELVAAQPAVQTLPWRGDVANARRQSFRIQRWPIKAAVPPLQLPAGAVIDLDASGTESVPSLFAPANKTDTTPIVILYSPNGSLDRVYYANQVHPVIEPIHLLVGRRERLPNGTAPDGLANFQDLTNLWIALNPQTGIVTSHRPSTPNAGQPPQNIAESLEFVHQSVGIGGGG